MFLFLSHRASLIISYCWFGYIRGNHHKATIFPHNSKGQANVQLQNHCRFFYAIHIQEIFPRPASHF